VPDATPKYSTIIFDLDGTIANTLPLIYRAFNAALGPVYRRELPPEEIRAMFGPPDNHIIRDTVPRDAADAAYARYVTVYQDEHDEHVTLFEGLKHLLEDATAQGITLAVVTGKSRITAIFTLEQLGVAPCFEIILAGDDVARQKPDPEALFAVFAQLGRQPDRTAVIVGDSAADVLAGRAAGIDTIGVLWGVPDHPDLLAAGPDVLCENVDQLRSALGLDRKDVTG